jgi:altronate dehydratase large subunit
MNIRGYPRSDGGFGIRNHLLVLSTVVCANEAVLRICARVQRAAAVTHPAGCCMLGRDFLQFRRTLLGTACNPNVGAVLVIGLGCEQIAAADFATEIARTGRKTLGLTVQRSGGVRNAVRAGV